MSQKPKSGQHFYPTFRTLDDVNILWEFNIRAGFVAQSFTEFKRILGFSTSL